MDIKGVIRGFFDKIFEPPISFLELAIDKLQEVQLVTAQGLNIGSYFSVFGDLPEAWQMVVSSVLLSTVLLGTLLIFRSIMRMYFAVKEGVKWW
ncbi:hypothetical protein [Bacillus sp. B15-48]|uniref:hypothetical protein n=1 Tax=Bacillus sp. B15-48 TaxID=1548601 RepID=UPI00193FBA4B|nr:hypothetical protein [Bacillus sp. B15-48]